MKLILLMGVQAFGETTETARRNCCIWRLGRAAPGGTIGSGTALQVVRSRVRFPMVSLEFFIDIILQAALWPWS